MSKPRNYLVAFVLSLLLFCLASAFIIVVGAFGLLIWQLLSNTPWWGTLSAALVFLGIFITVLKSE